MQPVPLYSPVPYVRQIWWDLTRPDLTGPDLMRHATYQSRSSTALLFLLFLLLLLLLPPFALLHEYTTYYQTDMT